MSALEVVQRMVKSINSRCLQQDGMPCASCAEREKASVALAELIEAAGLSVEGDESGNRWFIKRADGKRWSQVTHTHWLAAEAERSQAVDAALARIGGAP